MPEGRLFRNRVALVLPDAPLAAVLAAALGADGLLSPVLVVSSPEDPRLAAVVGQLDAVLLDPTAAPGPVVEGFLGRVRQSYPGVVFFLLTAAGRSEEALGRFSPAWRERLWHYFTFDLDQPMSLLPAAIRKVAAKIVFDQKWGRSVTP